MTLFASQNPTSDLDVVNLALAQLGQDTISSFDENNKRARMSNALYPTALRTVLTRGHWSFARRVRDLQLVADVDIETKIYSHVYGRPSDCLMGVGLLPLTRRLKWEMVKGQIHTHVYPATFYYTTQNVDASEFTPPFVTVLAFYMAGLLAYPLTQDADVGNDMLTTQFRTVLFEGLEADANIGSQHLHLDRNPRHDTFVDPDGGMTLTQYDLEFEKRYLWPKY